MRIDSIAAFREHAEAMAERYAARSEEIMVCCGTGCLAKGSKKVAEAFAAEVDRRKLDIPVSRYVKTTGCQGFCERGPLVILRPANTMYMRVGPKAVEEIVEKTVIGGELIPRLLYKDTDGERISDYRKIPFYADQTRVAMRNLGMIDPTDIDEAIAYGAYAALAKALDGMTGEEVLDEVDRSGLRGRGGAGFKTGRKWRSCKHASGERKFVICNGDEGDPGAFKDGSIMEGDPHSILEGMVLGAYAIGAHEGWIYVRDEYPLAVTNLTLAIAQARRYGFLGENILGSGFDFDIRISRGGGAFVCGESSALMLSLAGKVGEPRAKYVHSTEKGLFDLPTVLNNVETWADVPWIVAHGGGAFAAMGAGRSKGTKAFCISGKAKNTGLIELEMGTPLRDIVFGLGGGILGDRPFKAVQTGGPSGGCVPEELLDLPVDYEKLTAAGSMMGSGGMIVMDDRTCMVDVSRFFLEFLAEESCGKCVPCREGLKQMLAMFDDLCEGRGKPGDLEKIERLAAGMQLGSLCELGKSAPNPVLSTLKYFRDEYEAHVQDKACPAGVCRALTAYEIVDELCDGCHVCFKACPVDAISGVVKEKHVIHHDACISCGACFDVCPTSAIRTFPKVELEQRQKKEVV